MNTIKRIYKKDIQSLLDDVEFWKTPFLSISRHRLYAHLKNPDSDDNDIVLLLAYTDGELVGYMGVYKDKIILDGNQHKIGWLSTWWVHPKTKGSGIGREILNTMYEENGGKIGISQFTPSAKRVYDKSGYFYTLKESVGIKAVLKSNTAFLIPEIYPKFKVFRPVFKLADGLVNLFVNLKLYFQKQSIRKRLANTNIDYVTTIDSQTQSFIEKHNANHISHKSSDFYHWLKACRWVEDAPVLELTNKERYEFSMYDKSFDIYLMKVTTKDTITAFVVLQRRHKMLKVLYAYYDENQSSRVADIVKLQAIALDVNEILCYDKGISPHLKSSGVFLYKRKKVKQSIISKVFGKEDFDDVIVNFGDGDCSFA